MGKFNNSSKIKSAKDVSVARNIGVNKSKDIVRNLNENKWIEGLSELLSFIQHCDEGLLLSEGSKWFKICSQLFSKKIPKECVISAALVMKYLLYKCRSHAKLRVDISKLSSNFLSDLCKRVYEMTIEAFELIYEYLLLYSSQSMPCRKILEKTVLNYLIVDERIMGTTTEKYYPKVVAAARIYSVLPCSGTYVSETRIRAKSNQLLELIYLAHQQMDTLFKVVVEIEENSIKGHCSLNIPNKNIVDKTMEPIQLYTSAVAIFCNSLIFIQEFLHYTDSDLKIACRPILSILIRPMQVYAVENRKDLEYELFKSLLPKIHQRALITMKNMLLNNHGEFDNVYGIMLERLIYCISCDKESSLLCPKTKECTYDALAALRRASSGSGDLSISVCNLILRDITPPTNIVDLPKNETLSTDSYDGLPITCRSNSKYSKAQDNVVISALTFIEVIYNSVFCNLSSKFAQKLNNGLMNVLLNLNVSPYKNPAVRKVFFEAILANIMQPMRNVVPLSLSTIIDILNRRKRQETPENVELIEQIHCCLPFYNESIYKNTVTNDNVEPPAEEDSSFEVIDVAEESTSEMDQDEFTLEEENSEVALKVQQEKSSDVEIDESSEEEIELEKEDSSLEEDYVEIVSEKINLDGDEEVSAIIQTREESESETSTISEEDNEVDESPLKRRPEIEKSEEIQRMMNLFVPNFK